MLMASSLCICLGLAFCVFFWLILDDFVLTLFAFDMSGLITSILRQEMGLEEYLQNDLFCVH